MGNEPMQIDPDTFGVRTNASMIYDLVEYNTLLQLIHSLSKKRKENPTILLKYITVQINNLG